MSQENVEIVRRVFEGYNRWGANPRGARNPEVMALLHPEIEFHTYARAPEAASTVAVRRCSCTPSRSLGSSRTSA